jgi:hypothetical protein
MILFRCSGVHALLTEPKTKAEKEIGGLSQASKIAVKGLWLFREYGYLEQVKSDCMDKGNECEQDSMELAQTVLGGEFRSRFATKLRNDYVIGTPDIVLQTDYVEDIKTSWNLRTFSSAELSPQYYTQAQCYLWLTGKRNYRLIYCLVPTPQHLVEKEKNKLAWSFGNDYENKDYIAQCEQIQKNSDLINDIPNEDKVKVFEFTFDEEFIENLKLKINNAREFYKTIKL